MQFVYPDESQQIVYPVLGSGGGGGSTNVKTEYRTISAPEDAAKQLTLSLTPDTASEVVLSIASGSAQFYGSDFSVSGSTLSWSGLALDGVLAAGDKLIIFYKY